MESSEIIASIGGRDVRIPSMSLFELEKELVELVQLREVLIEEGESLDGVNEQIAAYIHREIQKVDAIRSYVKHAELMELGAKEEASAQHARAKSWRARIDYLKECCKSAMQVAGVKKLEGRTGSLSLRTHGGVLPLTVTEDARLVPDEYCSAWITLPWQQYQNLLQALTIPWRQFLDGLVQRIPVKDAIRKALDDGKDVSGCRLEGRGQSLVVK